MERTSRVQFELDEDRVEELRVLMEDTGIRTKKDLMNTALTFLQWAVGEVSRGRIIASVDEEAKKYKELYMPAFATASARMRKTEVETKL